MAAKPGIDKGLEVARVVEKDLFAALGKPLVEFDSTHVKPKGKKGEVVTTTTHGEVNLFTLGLAALGLGVTAWVMGIGLAPVTTTRTVTTPGQGYHPAHLEDPGNSRSFVPAYWDVPPTTKDVPSIGLTLVERPRMLLPFTSSSGSGTTGNTGIDGGGLLSAVGLGLAFFNQLQRVA